MMRFPRKTCGLVLAALIVVTALHVGAARGQAQVAGSVVLCAGAGPVVVAVDADGQPIGHAKTCPDCIMSVLAGPDVPAAHRLPASRLQRLPVGRSRVTGRSQALRCPPARGPPWLS